MLGISVLKQTRVFQEFYEDGQRDGLEQGRQEGLEAGRQQESLALVQRLLGRRLGDLPEVWRVRLATLGLSPLEELAEALLDFQSLADLQDWWQLWQEPFLPFPHPRLKNQGPTLLPEGDYPRSHLRQQRSQGCV